MQHVCNDLDGTTPWHYHPEERAYYRSYDNGRHQGKIDGDHLADPNFLWEQRNNLVRKAVGALTPEVIEYNKPTDVSFALWADWMRRNQ